MKFDTENEEDKFPDEDEDDWDEDDEDEDDWDEDDKDEDIFEEVAAELLQLATTKK